jgi:hypothetical protein
MNLHSENSIGSTDYLRLMTKNDCHVVLERATPRGRLKRDLATIVSNDGCDVALQTAQGSTSCPFELPVVILDDFLHASLMCRDGAEVDGRTTFRLTEDGRKRGREQN